MRSLPEHVSRADVALAVGLAALVCTEAGSEAYTAPALWVPVSAGGMLALVLRRRRPAEVAVLVSAVQVPLAAAAGGPDPPQLPVLGVLLAIYTAALELPGRRAAVTGAATLALAVAAHVLTGDGELTDFWPYLLWAGPVLAGRLVRRRTLEAAAAARAAAALVAQQQAETREAVARERDRIARELHDVVAHAVSLMVVQAGAERTALGSDPASDRTRSALAAVEAAGREALGELRTMLGVLRAPDDEQVARLPQPDLSAVPELVARVQAAGTAVRWRSRGDLSSVPPGVGLSAYRVVQEALTNAVRHAAGRAVDLDVQIDAHEVRIAARNALPAVPPQPTAGRGLLGVRERAVLLGGTAVTGPADGEWVVEVRLPLPSARAPA